MAVLATVITMTIWEVAKQAFFPPSTIWWSHVLTILFAGVLAFPISLTVLKTLRTKILSEETSRLMAEAKHSHAEDVLQETESQLAHAEAIIHLGHWSWDITRDEVSWSSEMFRIYGLGPGDFGGDLASVVELVHPDDRCRHEKFIAAEAGMRGRSGRTWSSSMALPAAIRVCNASCANGAEPKRPKPAS